MKSPFTKEIAIIIGIQNYADSGNHISSLKTPLADANDVASLLESHYGYTHDLNNARCILCLHDTTLAQLEDLLRQLPDLVPYESCLLFYFAGHGIALPTAEENGIAAPRGFLLPVDAKRGDTTSHLSMETVYSQLSKLNCLHCLLVFDCCFAGAFRWSAYQYRNACSIEAPMTDARYTRFTTRRAWQVIASAAQSEQAIDCVAGGELGRRFEEGEGGNGSRNSPFARLFIDGLTPHLERNTLVCKADINRDGYTTVKELVTYIQNNIIGQNPQEFPLPKHDSGEFLFCRPELPDPPMADPKNPYLGLFPYAEDKGNLFYGREDEIALLYSKLWLPLATNSTTSNLLVVTGPSGAGKSSLVRAGLLPRLREWKLFHDWANRFGLKPPPQCIIPDALRPGAQPLEELDRLLANAPAEGEWIVTVDQAEELVTLGGTDAADKNSRCFFQRLREMATRFHGTLRLILTVRTDFEPQVRRLYESVGPAPEWDEALFPITPMTPEELREVISFPAAFESVYFTEQKRNNKTLVDTLVNEVNQMPGALPLLSYTLNQMFDAYYNRAEGDYEITWQDYDSVGGVISSLQKRADDIYRELPDDAHRDTMRRIMLRMVATEGGELSRRRARLLELEYKRSANNLFLPMDFQNLTGIVAHLNNAQDAFALYIWHQLSPQIQNDLSSIPASLKTQNRLRQALASEINRLLQQEILYSPLRCKKIKLSKKTLEMLDNSLQGENRILFNRRLLEDAFPSLRSEDRRVEWVLDRLDKARLIVLGTEDGR